MLIGLLSWSCKDELPEPCDCEGQPEGRICREIRYDKENYIGYVSYSYGTDGKLKDKEWFNPSGSDKIASYTYNAAGRLIREDITFHNRIGFAKWEHAYNDTDSLVRSAYSENGNLISEYEFEYNPEHLLLKKSLTENGVLTAVFRYSYDETGRLWRMEEYEGDGSLDIQRYYTYFSNHTERVEIYKGETEYLGYDFINRLTSGEILEIKHYGPNQELKGYLLNDYHGGRISRTADYDQDSHVKTSTLFVYY